MGEVTDVVTTTVGVAAQAASATRTCPQCGSGDYAFRGRKKVATTLAVEGGEAVETWYRCKSCDHDWRVRVPAGG